MLVRVLAMASVCVLLLVSVSTTTTLHMFNGPFSGLPRWAGTRKVKPIWILLKQETVSGSGIKPICILLNQETVSGSGISWDICKSSPLSRQITMLAPHHSVFYRPDALPAARPIASKHWRRLSQVGVISKGMDRLIWFFAWRLFSTSPTLCYKEIQVSTEIRLRLSIFVFQFFCFPLFSCCLQCFDAVGWAAGRASGL